MTRRSTFIVTPDGVAELVNPLEYAAEQRRIAERRREIHAEQTRRRAAKNRRIAERRRLLDLGIEPERVDKVLP